jgi:sugar phosphate isomerase/epimerase
MTNNDRLRLSRREALRALAGAGLAVGAASCLRARTTERKMTMDLVGGNIGLRTSFPETIALAAKHGFESIGADVGYLARLDDAGLVALKEEMAAKGLVFGAAALNVDIRGDDATFTQGLKELPRVAAALRRAGVTRMGTWVRPAHPRLTYLANFRLHAGRLKQVASVLGGQGIKLGLEYVGPKTSWTSARYPFIHTMSEMKELIDAIGRDDVGLVLDSWHWYCAGESVDDLTSLRASDVIAVDLNDAPAGIPVDQQKDSVRELPCVTEVIDLKGFLGALLAIGYDGPVRAEPFKAELRSLPPDEAVARTATAMRKAFALIGT